MNKKKAIKRTSNRQGIRKKAHLLEAAATVFAKYGYGNTTIRDIAEEAEVQPSALIYHFSSKENLFYQTLRHFIVDNAKWDTLFSDFEEVDPLNKQQMSQAMYSSIKKAVKLCHGPKGQVKNLNGLIICMLNDGGVNVNNMVQKLVDEKMKQICTLLRTSNPHLTKSDVFWWNHMFWSLLFYPAYGRPLILSHIDEKKYTEEFTDTLALRMAKAICSFLDLPIPTGEDTWLFDK